MLTLNDTCYPTKLHIPEGEGLNVLRDQPSFAPDRHRPLYGKRVLVTAGPTHEPIDPVRYIGNRSSGRQGFAIAAAAADMGADVVLVAGPVQLATPAGVTRVDVETAREMQAAVIKSLPVDAAVMVAAVADWRVRDSAVQKIKKTESASPPLELAENPDILAQLAKHERRPHLLIGFAAETENVLENARRKLDRKGSDWIVANDVSGGVEDSVMGGGENTVHIITAHGVESWEKLPKAEVARKLMEKLADALAGN